MTGTIRSTNRFVFPLEVSLPIVGESHPLRAQYAHYLFRAISIALLLHLTVVTSWVCVRSLRSVPANEIISHNPFQITSPPPINEKVAMQRIDPGSFAPPDISFGVPEPVRDYEAVFSTIGTKMELSGFLTPIEIPGEGEGPFSAGEIVIPQAEPDRLPGEGVFFAAEEPPILISLPAPVYPEMARLAGVEGTVVVRVLVGKDGKVHDALVANGIPMLDSAALDAARKAVFRPALQQHRPVAVWVDFPMRFVLD